MVFSTPSSLIRRATATLVAAGLALGFAPGHSFGSLLITGIIDGPRSGGFPKAIEMYATAAIADLSTYSVRNFNNGLTTPGITFALSGSATAGQYLYVASEPTGFTAYFGFAPDFTSSALNVNGDDVVQLILNTTPNTTPVDVFGVIGIDPPDNTAWNYLDSWFYRSNGSSATTSFQLADWFFAGPGSSASNALDSLGTSGVNPASGDLRMPIGTYAVPEPSTVGLAVAGGLGLAGIAARRRLRKA